jgi:hypothetical protein
MSQEVIEITEREIEVIEVVEKGPLGPIGPAGPQANINYTVVTANQTLSNSQNIAADTSSGSFTLSLPASPNAGDSIDIFDYANTFDTNPLTIARNGENIESLAEDLTANIEGAYFTLIYTGSTRGWQILPRYGVSGIEDVLSAEGDLLYRGASSETRLPIGTEGQVLKVNSGATAPEWGSISGSISVTGSDLTLSGATGTAITNATLATTGVGAGTYTKVTVDTKGRVTTGATATPADIGAAASSHTHAASNITSGTFDNARINFAAPPAIGNTTPAAGTFTTLTANNGTLTASAPVLDLGQTWDASGTTFVANQTNVTDTASSASSVLHRFNVGGTTVFQIEKDGTLRFGTAAGVGKINVAGLDRVNGQLLLSGTNNGVAVEGQGGLRISGFGSPSLAQVRSFQDMQVGPTANNTFLRLRSNGTQPIILQGGNHTVEQYNTTNPQTFNIYNTFTSATNHERGFLKWSSNVFQIGTEKGSGGGTARDLAFQTDGITRFTIQATTGRLVSLNSRIIIDDANNLVHVGNTPRITLIGTNNAYLALGLGTSLRFSSARSDQASVATIDLIRDEDGVLAQRSGTNAQTFRLYNTVSGTGNVNFDRVNFRWASNEFIIDAEAGGTGTLRGIKIGSATSSLLGFYGVTPVDQPALTADLLDSLQEVGLIASGSGDTPLNLSGGTLTAGNLVLTDNTGSETATFDAQAKLTDDRTYDLPDRSGTMVVSDTSAGSGSDVVNNIVSLTQAEYDAIGSPDAATLFLITDP